MGEPHAESARETKHEGITDVVKPFDWSYSTDFKGKVQSHGPSFQESSKEIPIELLKKPDPIIFYDEVVLYEDEMADNGITMLSCKIRVMPARLLLLCRFFMRLDGVVIRIRDTRVFVEFATGQVIREYVAKEEKYEVVREVVLPIIYLQSICLMLTQKLARTGQDAPARLRDPNNLTELLPVLDRSLECLQLTSPIK